MKSDIVEWFIFLVVVGLLVWVIIIACTNNVAPIVTREQRCSSAGGTYLWHEGKCIAVKEIKLD